MAGEPHLAESAFAELGLEPPVVAQGDALADRRAPAEDGVPLVQAAHRRRRCRRPQRRLALEADLVDLHRLRHALDLVGAVGQPAQARILGLVAHRGAAGDVEDAPGEQGLARRGKGGQPRGRRLGQAFDLERPGAAGDVRGRIGAQDHLAEVDAGAGGELDVDPGVELCHHLVIGRGVPYRRQRPRRMTEPGGGTRLAAEARPCPFTGGRLGEDALDRHVAFEALVPGEENLPHAAASERGLQAIAAQAFGSRADGAHGRKGPDRRRVRRWAWRIVGC